MEVLNGSIKLVLAEDQGLILHSLVSMLKTVPDFSVTGTAKTGSNYWIC